MVILFEDIQLPLEEIEFLARSPNRVSVLDTLRMGPIERYDIEAATGVSRATLGRILDEFEDRGWVIEHDRQYETTHLGAYVAREFMELLESFEPVPALNEVAQWFPEEGFDFDLGCLAGAEIVRPTRSNALAPTTYIANRLRTADQVRVLTYSVLPDIMAVCWRETVNGTLELKSVLDQGALQSFGADPQMVDHAQRMFESGQFEVVWYDGDIPSTVFIVDDKVLLCLSGGEGAPHAVIETTDETVRAWAESTFESYYSKSVPLDPALFTG